MEVKLVGENREGRRSWVPRKEERKEGRKGSRKTNGQGRIEGIYEKEGRDRKGREGGAERKETEGSYT
jgi:hypothetical protein